MVRASHSVNGWTTASRSRRMALGKSYRCLATRVAVTRSEARVMGLEEALPTHSAAAQVLQEALANSGEALSLATRQRVETLFLSVAIEPNSVTTMAVLVGWSSSTKTPPYTETARRRGSYSIQAKVETTLPMPQKKRAREGSSVRPIRVDPNSQQSQAMRSVFPPSSHQPRSRLRRQLSRSARSWRPKLIGRTNHTSLRSRLAHHKPQTRQAFSTCPVLSRSWLSWPRRSTSSIRDRRTALEVNGRA